MGRSDCWLRRPIVGCIVLLLAVPLGRAATPWPQQASSGQPAESNGGSVPVQSQQAQPGNLDSATGVTATAPQKAAPLPEGPQPAQPGDSKQQSDSSDTSKDALQPPQKGTSKPLGTAAAPYEKSTGVPASRPAGAVIAPAKQKRARSFLIKIGVIVGAAVAIGTIAALSKASPSQSK